MAKVEVLNWEGTKVSDLLVKDFLLKEKLNKPLLQKIVLWQLARRRKGDHIVKTRAQVRGGGKKPFRQKGTGNARQGSIRSPLLKGGGVIHGPKKRSYDWPMPKKVRQKALRNVLSYLFQEKRLFFIEDMKSSKGKTKEVQFRFKKMGWNKALLVNEKHEELFQRACQNLKNFKILQAEGLNVYDVLKYDRVVFTPNLLETLYRKCGLS